MPVTRALEQTLPDQVRILLIEDEPLCARIVVKFLEAIKWASPRVDVATRLREGLARLTLEKFDLVIIDLNLPDSTGLATLEAVARACDRLIIVVTGNDEPGLREKAIAGGAFELMHKKSLSAAALERLVRLATVQSDTVRSLRDSEARFRKTFELAASGIAHVDTDGRFMRVNRRCCEIVGYHESELVGRCPKEISHPDDREMTATQLARLRAGDVDAARLQKRYIRKDGSVVWVELTVALVRDAAAKPQYEIAIMEDITERKHAEAQQAAHTRYQEAIADFGQAALAKRDPAELVEEAVQTVLRALNAQGVSYCESGPAAGELVQRACAGCVSRGGDQVKAVLHSGTQFVCEDAAIVPVRGDNRVRGALSAYGECFSAEALAYLNTVASLLSTGLQRIESEGRLSFLAQFDPLTGLANRALLADRFSQTIVQAKRRGAPLGVLFVDLDEFKLVNDTLGHAGGDELLKETARRLQLAVRTGDTVARVSGDEFAVVLSDLARAEDAALVAQKILDRLSEPFTLLGEEAFVTASIGIAAYPGDGNTAEQLLGAADAAMYRAKQSGRNAYHFFTAEITQRTRARSQVALELRRALERNEFGLVYQPKVDLHTGIPCGAEALLRWHHPQRGVVSPADFVPVLEETGLIVPVGEWVIRRACEDIKVWQSAGLKVLPVAVNLSARQFRQQYLDARIRSLVHAGGVDPALIELEITESQLMDDPEHAIRIMNALRDAGIRTAIDDFGTGYSSLAYLTRLPVAALKIDRSFVADALTDAADAAIVRTIIDMAHTLDFTVVAEGVETDGQMAFLRQFGCEQGQGFLFARPMPASAFSALIA
jgi:diguanylate cyclase (GGDEF)-like protein/PAS domain S-box-containing protein